jgi:chromosome segregation ATPase
MARLGITYDEVVASANALIARGEEPTIMGVRAELGDTGSPNTIHRHLTTWKDAQPVAQRKVRELPGDLQNALLKEIDRQVADSRSEVERELVSAQKAAEMLSKEGEALEDQNAELEKENNELTGANGRLEALSEERQGEIKNLNDKLDTERKSLEEARIQIAQGRNKIDSLEDTITELKDRITQAVADLGVAERGRVDAEKAAAVADARLESEVKASSDLRSQLEKMTSKHDELVADLRSFEKERSKLSDTNYSLGRDLKDAIDGCSVETEKVSKLESLVAKLKVEKKDLRAENDKLKLEG